MICQAEQDQEKFSNGKETIFEVASFDHWQGKLWKISQCSLSFTLF
jgi:hypothetical protein